MSPDEAELTLRQVELCKELKIPFQTHFLIMGYPCSVCTKDGKMYLSVEYQIPDMEKQTLINVMKDAIEVQRKIQKV